MKVVVDDIIALRAHNDSTERALSRPVFKSGRCTRNIERLPTSGACCRGRATVVAIDERSHREDQVIGPGERRRREKTQSAHGAFARYVTSARAASRALVRGGAKHVMTRTHGFRLVMARGEADRHWPCGGGHCGIDRPAHRRCAVRHERGSEPDRIFRDGISSACLGGHLGSQKNLAS